jgi:nucleoside-diphosphate-sugar epimerase
MSIISIIGAGWLGFPLAQQLARDHCVYASKTTLAGLGIFSSTSIQGFVVSQDNIHHELKSQLLEQKPNVVIGCFPPGLRKGLSNHYGNNWQAIIDACETTGVEKVIMISTTGVYPDLPMEMVETDATYSRGLTNPDFSQKNKILLDAERVVEQSRLNTVIIRCGGLFGPQRHPSRFATRLKSVSSAAPANMLHLDDAINVITFSLDQINNEVINAVSPIKPSKAEFYQAALNHVGTPTGLPPIVDVADKSICVDKLLRYGFEFQYPSPLDALNSGEF